MSRFPVFTTTVFGPPIQREVITTFILATTFLGIMPLCWEGVGDRPHVFATCMAALGTLVCSAIRMLLRSRARGGAALALHGALVRGADRAGRKPPRDATLHSHLVICW